MKIKIESDFTDTPGGRYTTEGPYSGEEFRDTILIKKYLKACENNEKLIVDFDGTFGYATSFLEESFGGLVRCLKEKNILDNIEIIANDDVSIMENIKKYVFDAEEKL